MCWLRTKIGMKGGLLVTCSSLGVTLRDSVLGKRNEELDREALEKKN